MLIEPGPRIERFVDPTDADGDADRVAGPLAHARARGRSPRIDNFTTAWDQLEFPAAAAQHVRDRRC